MPYSRHRRWPLAARLLVAATAVAALGLAACGDDDSPFTTTGPTKLRFISEADSICRSYEPRVIEALEGLGGADEAELEPIADRLADVLGDQLAELEELSRPEQDRELLEQIFASVVSELVDLRREPETLDRPNALFARTSELATEYGFQDCGDVG